MTIVCFYFLTAFGQNGLTGGDYFLLLKDKKTISLNTYKDDEINEIRTFTIPENSMFTTDQKERVAIIDIHRNIVTLYEIQTSKEVELSIPHNLLNPKTLLLNDHNLFIGGESKGRGSIEKQSEMLVQYHIQNEKWYQLEIPVEVLGFGKAVDDLVINDSLLIAIDNLLMPKYILFYRLNITEKLAFSHFEILGYYGISTNIHQGKITSKYLGIRSISYNGSNNISISKGFYYKKSFFISSWQRDRSYHTFNDFLIIGNKVVIASKENGLGFLKIRKSYFNRHKRIKASKISYKKYKGENIINLTLIPNTTRIVLTIEDNRAKIRHEIIKL